MHLPNEGRVADPGWQRFDIPGLAVFPVITSLINYIYNAGD